MTCEAFECGQRQPGCGQTAGERLADQRARLLLEGLRPVGRQPGLQAKLGTVALCRFLAPLRCLHFRLGLLHGTAGVGLGRVLGAPGRSGDGSLLRRSVSLSAGHFLLPLLLGDQFGPLRGSLAFCLFRLGQFLARGGALLLDPRICGDVGPLLVQLAFPSEVVAPRDAAGQPLCGPGHAVEGFASEGRCGIHFWFNSLHVWLLRAYPRVRCPFADVSDATHAYVATAGG